MKSWHVFSFGQNNDSDANVRVGGHHLNYEELYTVQTRYWETVVAQSEGKCLAAFRYRIHFLIIVN